MNQNFSSGRPVGFYAPHSTRPSVSSASKVSSRSGSHTDSVINSNYPTRRNEKVVTEEDFIEFLLSRNIVVNRSELRILFLEADRDGDGILNQKEFRELNDRIQKPLKINIKLPNRVFLGGSCNPTTWRKTIAIPKLEQEKITYYNPQVDEWHPGLVELERKAKESATILLFVVDDQTRAVVSMLEAAEFIGRGRHLVLTAQEVKTNLVFGDSTLDQDEVDALNEARHLVSLLARKSHLETFSSVTAAVLHIISLFDPLTQRVKKTSVYTPYKLSAGMIDDSNIMDIFIDNGGEVDPETLTIVFNYLGFYPSTSEMKKIFGTIDKNKDNRVDFEEFSSFLIYLAELQDQNSPFRNLTMSSALLRISSNVDSYDMNKLISRVEHTNKIASFVYLGGSFSGNDWRKDIAIPALASARVTFFNPQIGRDFPNFSCIEWNGRNQCSVFLFVISSDARCIKGLAEAAYYIGLGRSVVLVINDVKEGASFGSKLVTASELKDLNRGRAYLRESAKVASVPVFDNVTSAIQHIIKLGRK